MSPAWFVVGGVVWFALVVLAFALARAAERAYDSHDRTDRPHAVTRDGDGVLCSPLCVLRDELEHHCRDTAADCAQRVAAVREALLAEADVEAVTLHVGDEAITGYPCDWGREQITLELDSGDEASVQWSRVLDAGLA